MDNYRTEHKQRYEHRLGLTGPTDSFERALEATVAEHEPDVWDELAVRKEELRVEIEKFKAEGFLGKPIKYPKHTQGIPELHHRLGLYADGKLTNHQVKLLGDMLLNMGISLFHEGE